jgi:hypothetical protein
MQQEGILRDLAVCLDQVYELFNALLERHSHAYVYMYIYLNYDVILFFDFRRVSYLADRPLKSLRQF